MASIMDSAITSSGVKSYSTSTPALQTPPSLKDIDVEKIYGPFIPTDYDIGTSKYSKPNTDKNIVSVVFVRHG